MSNPLHRVKRSYGLDEGIVQLITALLDGFGTSLVDLILQGFSESIGVRLEEADTGDDDLVIAEVLEDGFLLPLEGASFASFVSGEIVSCIPWQWQS